MVICMEKLAMVLVREIPYAEMMCGEWGAELAGYDLEADSGTQTIRVYRLASKIREKQ